MTNSKETKVNTIVADRKTLDTFLTNSAKNADNIQALVLRALKNHWAGHGVNYVAMVLNTMQTHKQATKVKALINTIKQAIVEHSFITAKRDENKQIVKTQDGAVVFKLAKRRFEKTKEQALSQGLTLEQLMEQKFNDYIERLGGSIFGRPAPTSSSRKSIAEMDSEERKQAETKASKQLANVTKKLLALGLDSKTLELRFKDILLSIQKEEQENASVEHKDAA